MHKKIEDQRAKYIIEGMVIVVVVLLIVIFSSSRMNSPSGSINSQDQAQAAFPSDVPIQSSGAVNSGSATTPSGQVQLMRSFESANTASALFSLYQQFLSANGGNWTIITKKNNPSQPSILARSNQGFLTLSINAMSPSTSFVAMIFVTNPVSR